MNRPAPPVPLVVTGATPGAFAAAAARAGTELAAATGPPARAGRALAARADPDHPYRRVVLAHPGDDLAALTAPPPDPVAGPGGLAFLFSGQSSQRPGMGTGLAAGFGRVADTVGRVAAVADPRLGAPLAEVLADPGVPGESGLRLVDRTEYTQPALLAVALGLHRLLGDVGIVPDVVCGHSFGEIAAAAAADVWTVEDAAGVAVERGHLFGGLPAGGVMIAVEAGEAAVAPLLAGTGVELSAVHTPGSVVLAGPAGAARGIAAALAARGVRTTELAVGGAYHSAAVDPLLEPLRAVLTGLPARPATVPLVGNATGAVVPPGAPADPEHWVRHCRRCVRWSEVMTTLRDRGTRTYLEIGPGGVLSRLAAANLDPAEQPATLAATGAEPDETTAFLQALTALDARGHRVDWPAVFTANRDLAA